MTTTTGKTAIIGGGSWATALAKLINDKDVELNWWIYEKEISDHISQYSHNPQYLSSVEFQIDFLRISNDIQHIIDKSDTLVFCVPAAFLHSVCRNIRPGSLNGKIIVSTIKGVVPEYHQIPADYFADVLLVRPDCYVVASGPSHAEEVAREKLTYLTIASQNPELTDLVAGLFSGRFLRTITCNDVHGIEYATVLKNIYAIAAGICKGLGYGDNFIAVLISNCHQEMHEFLSTIGQNHRKISRSAYLGDLIVTAYSQHSRNRNLGTMIGSGYSVASARLEMRMIAEGYYAARSINEITRSRDISLPICHAVYQILYENADASRSIRELSKIFK
ncbi:MAG: NAD(P)H-dependent glycerol-3-phosphate dehydrogenase [Bacteroidetes bacterium]|nr:NAD(P)H-dependent glycerol-3-phosphate dehydrogenase [Bacteroidota bacterium]MBU1718339.1 NAD(P)H-dependent glycerol-3-phosphate dehydrogenase [Bacteroidota bacterium]